MGLRQNKESGVVTVDATISLCLTVFLMVLIIDVGAVYQAQNYTYHGVLQTTKALSVYVHRIDIREDADSELETLVKNMLKSINVLQDTQEEKVSRLWQKDKVGNARQIAEMMYPVCLAGDMENANRQLQQYGIADGLHGMDFTGTTIDTNKQQLIVKAKMRVNFPLPVFGFAYIDLEQSACARLWEGK